MNMSINGNRPSKYVTISYGLFYKNIQTCRLFSTNLPEITASLKRTEVSGSGQEERRLRTNTAIPKLSDVQDWSRPSLQSKACSVDHHMYIQLTGIQLTGYIICTYNLRESRKYVGVMIVELGERGIESI